MSDNGQHEVTQGRACCKWGLYVILDAEIAGVSHVEAARHALAGGAKVIQLRDKLAPFEELVDIGKELRRMTRQADAILIANDNPYLAVEIDADGVHLGQNDIPVEIARDIVGHERLIGLSTHTHQQALDARKLPVDYIGVGPVYATTSKKSEWSVVGPDMVRWVKNLIPLPVVAIGGINRERMPEVLAAGADNIAMIREIMAADDITARTREVCQLINSARENV